MNDDDMLGERWLDARRRLVDKGLLASRHASLSVRCAGRNTMWFGEAHADGPRDISWSDGEAGSDGASVHAAIYRLRRDVGAVALGGARFGEALADFGGVLPVVFDEQARHIGRMGAAAQDDAGLADALRHGGNALMFAGVPVCLGATCQRMVLNAELFEKCAKAWVLATATGGHVRPLPWWVQVIANRRLMKDETRAALRFAQGRFPDEARGY